ncbi:hypothetical protein ACM61V_04800 [Sphingomonas sp. TX0543]|uniref:hypothetical protein n=1 Tax=unclassified Sphingomonas TaxID=196159 RepID=UPI0010F6C8B3|nr:hypothetical protein [Sphingomonas sp. 3P27F8]
MSPHLSPDRTYHSRRAYQEAVHAIRTPSADASASHDELCRLHCRRFVAAMNGENRAAAA